MHFLFNLNLLYLVANVNSHSYISIDKKHVYVNLSVHCFLWNIPLTA